MRSNVAAPPKKAAAPKQNTMKSRSAVAKGKVRKCADFTLRLFFLTLEHAWTYEVTLFSSPLFNLLQKAIDPYSGRPGGGNYGRDDFVDVSEQDTAVDILAFEY